MSSEFQILYENYWAFAFTNLYGGFMLGVLTVLAIQAWKRMKKDERRND